VQGLHGKRGKGGSSGWGGGNSNMRAETKTNCSSRKETTVPFSPTRAVPFFAANDFQHAAAMARS